VQVRGPAASAAGAGIGQKSLSQFCAEQGIELSRAIAVLQGRGLKVTQAMTMRQIADAAGVHPRDLRTLLQTQ
jgi:hypothetical protein